MIPIKPVGYRMLIRQVAQENKSSGGIILATEEEHQRQMTGSPVFEVLAQGPACYRSRDGKEFPEGRWSEVGDVVVMDSYPGKSYQPKEFFSKYMEDDEALKELREMQKDGRNFHIVSDENVMGVMQ